MYEVPYHKLQVLFNKHVIKYCKRKSIVDVEDGAPDSSGKTQAFEVNQTAPRLSRIAHFLQNLI